MLYSIRKDSFKILRVFLFIEIRMRYKNSETRKIGRIFRGFHNFERYAAMLRIVLIRERFFVFRIKWMKKKKEKDGAS